MAELLFDALERAQLCDLLVELAPDAPTLLPRWTTRDLAAHLVLREHDPLAAPGLVLPGAWHRFADRRCSPVATSAGWSTPGELLPFLFGRGAVAEVDVIGDPAAVATVHATAFGM